MPAAWSNGIAGASDCIGASVGRCGMAVPAGALNYVKADEPRCSSSKRSKGCRVGAWRRPIAPVPGMSRSFRSKRRARTAFCAGHASGQILRLGDPDGVRRRRGGVGRVAQSGGGLGRASSPPTPVPALGFLPRSTHQHDRAFGFPVASAIHATQCGPRASLRIVPFPGGGVRSAMRASYCKGPRRSPQSSGERGG